MKREKSTIVLAGFPLLKIGGENLCIYCGAGAIKNSALLSLSQMAGKPIKHQELCDHQKVGLWARACDFCFSSLRPKTFRTFEDRVLWLWSESANFGSGMTVEDWERHEEKIQEEKCGRGLRSLCRAEIERRARWFRSEEYYANLMVGDPLKNPMLRLNARKCVDLYAEFFETTLEELRNWKAAKSVKPPKPSEDDIIISDVIPPPAPASLPELDVSNPAGEPSHHIQETPQTETESPRPPDSRGQSAE